MSNHKDHSNKVSAFPGRREKAATLINQETPTTKLGGDQGVFQRPPCGTCLSWKRRPEMGLNQGVCMFGPPYSIPIQGPNGQQGQMLIRATMQAEYEGCDQHDNGEDEDGPEGGIDAPESKLVQAG